MRHIKFNWEIPSYGFKLIDISFNDFHLDIDFTFIILGFGFKIIYIKC